jgi:23S rRNA (uracil-5-)-methyltransferase RumA
MAEPLCRYYGECGGCSLQHVEHEKQIEQKKKILADSIKFSEIKVFSGKDYSYRNKMEFIFSNFIGLRKKDDFRQIIDVDKCVICNENINDILKEVKDFFKDFDNKTGTFIQAIIRSSSFDSGIVFILNEKSMKLGEAVEKIKEFSSKTKVENIVVSYSKPEDEFIKDHFTVKGSDMIKEKLVGKIFYYSLTGFFQNNTFVAEKMQVYCNELLKKYDLKNACLLDLYAGAGTFGIINASLFKNVFIIESVKSCIDAANKNIKENDIINAKAICLDAGQLKKVNLSKPLYAVIDPPRSGMDNKTIEELKKLKPEVIIYISCNLHQLSKDILKFKNYKIKSAAMFDMFPQTKHIEVVVEIVLR